MEYCPVPIKSRKKEESKIIKVGGIGNSFQVQEEISQNQSFARNRQKCKNLSRWSEQGIGDEVLFAMR